MTEIVCPHKSNYCAIMIGPKEVLWCLFSYISPVSVFSFPDAKCFSTLSVLDGFQKLDQPTDQPTMPETVPATEKITLTPKMVIEFPVKTPVAIVEIFRGRNFQLHPKIIVCICLIWLIHQSLKISTWINWMTWVDIRWFHIQTSFRNWYESHGNWYAMVIIKLWTIRFNKFSKWESFLLY